MCRAAVRVGVRRRRAYPRAGPVAWARVRVTGWAAPRTVAGAEDQNEYVSSMLSRRAGLHGLMCDLDNTALLILLPCGDTPLWLYRHGTFGQFGRGGEAPMEETTRQSVLEVDSRRRISLGPLAEHDRYLVEVEEDGTIVLTPAVVMSAAQARLLAAAETSRRIDEFLDHPETGTRRTRPARSRPSPSTEAVSRE